VARANCPLFPLIFPLSTRALDKISDKN